MFENEEAASRHRAIHLVGENVFRVARLDSWMQARFDRDHEELVGVPAEERIDRAYIFSDRFVAFATATRRLIEFFMPVRRNRHPDAIAAEDFVPDWSAPADMTAILASQLTTLDKWYAHLSWTDAEQPGRGALNTTQCTIELNALGRRFAEHLAANEVDLAAHLLRYIDDAEALVASTMERINRRLQELWAQDDADVSDR